jgi:sarcosine oxidase/L-pipecolate oxidase
MASDKVRVLVVGAGCFGVSTALHLLRDPDHKYIVKIIDRASVLPALDAASTDLNKIVRTSYSDAWYAHFAQEAIALWRADEIFHNVYHERVPPSISNSSV